MGREGANLSINTLYVTLSTLSSWLIHEKIGQLEGLNVKTKHYLTTLLYLMTDDDE